MTKRMAIGIAHPPGSLVEVMLRGQGEMQMIIDLFTQCAARASCATI